MSVKVPNHEHESDLGPEFDMGSTLLSSYPGEDSATHIVQRKSTNSEVFPNPGSPNHQDNESLQKSNEASAMETSALNSQPLPLVKQWAFDTFINAVFVSIVLALLVFSTIAGRLHGKPIGVPQHYTMLRDISDKIATLFPIIFAAIIGRMFKKIASYRLERGSTLGLLEQISGSQTLGNTIGTQFYMRSFSILTAVLLATWSLSPLGSQGSLQFLSTNTIPVLSNTSVTYSDTRSQNGWIFGNVAIGLAYPLNALYNSLLLSPPSIQAASMDLWSNLKIPDLKYLKANSTANSTGWLDASAQSNVTYASLLGIPLSNIPSTGATEFTIESAYFTLDSLNSTIGPAIEFTPIYSDADGKSTFQKRQAFKFGSQPASNLYYGISTNITFSMATNGFMNVTQNGIQLGSGGADSLINDTSQWEARTLLFQSQNLQSIVRAYCTVTMTYLESAVTCAGKTCEVTAIRPSQQKHPSANFTDWNIESNFYTFTNLFIESVNQLSSGKPGMTVGPGSTATELYIQDPSLVASAALKTATLDEVDVNTLGIRLQQLINTYWWGGIDPRTMLLGIVNGSTQRVPLQTTALHSVPQAHYLISWGWLVVFLVANLVMLAAAIAGAVYGALLRGPELIGYCSSLTRGTPFVQGGYTQSTLQGLDRSKEFSEVKLRLVDVQQEKEAGLILVAEDDGSRGSLKKGKLYK